VKLFRVSRSYLCMIIRRTPSTISCGFVVLDNVSTLVRDDVLSTRRTAGEVSL
jgi:hypothetical protein